MLTRGKSLLLAGVVVGGLIALGAVFPGLIGTPGEVSADHYEETEYSYGNHDKGVNEYVIRSYGDDPMSEQRAPEAEDRSWWSETIIHTPPDDERLYLNQSIVYRPGSSGECEVADLDEFGIDRGNDWEGERETDTEVVQNLDESYTEFERHDEFKEEHGDFGPLVDPQVDDSDVHVEKTVVVWHDRDHPAGPPWVEQGDRFVAAQNSCWVNPSEPGWYRWASASTSTYENGTDRQQAHPDFSHWFWICECESEQEAREQLGPPPHEREDGETVDDDGSEDPTPTEASDDGETGDDDSEDPTPTEASDDGETGDDDGSGDDGSGDDGSGDDGSGDDGSADDGETGDDETQNQNEDTPDADGPGFGAIAALVAVAAALLAVKRQG